MIEPSKRLETVAGLFDVEPLQRQCDPKETPQILIVFNDEDVPAGDHPGIIERLLLP